jgi:hypothetical protein
MSLKMEEFWNSYKKQKANKKPIVTAHLYIVGRGVSVDALEDLLSTNYGVISRGGKKGGEWRRQHHGDTVPQQRQGLTIFHFSCISCV